MQPNFNKQSPVSHISDVLRKLRLPSGNKTPSQPMSFAEQQELLKDLTTRAEIYREVKRGNFDNALALAIGNLNLIEANFGAEHRFTFTCRAVVLNVAGLGRISIEDRSILAEAVERGLDTESPFDSLKLKLLRSASNYTASLGRSDYSYREITLKCLNVLHQLDVLIPDGLDKSKTRRAILSSCIKLLGDFDTDTRQTDWLAEAAYERLLAADDSLGEVLYSKYLLARFDFEQKFVEQDSFGRLEEPESLLYQALELAKKGVTDTDELYTDSELARKELEFQCYTRLKDQERALEALEVLRESLDRIEDIEPDFERASLKNRVDSYLAKIN